MIVCILARKHGDEAVTHLECGCSHGERYWLAFCKQHATEQSETHYRWATEHAAYTCKACGMVPVSRPEYKCVGCLT